MSVRSQLEKKIEMHEQELKSMRADLLCKEAFLSGLRQAFEIISADEDGEDTKRRGDGRLFLRGKTWWIAFYVDGEERRESAETEDEDKARNVLTAAKSRGDSRASSTEASRSAYQRGDRGLKREARCAAQASNAAHGDGL